MTVNFLYIVRKSRKKPGKEKHHQCLSEPPTDKGEVKGRVLID